MPWLRATTFASDCILIFDICRLRGRVADYRVRPEAIAGIAIPVIAVLALLLVTTLWLDLTDPIRL